MTNNDEFDVGLELEDGVADDFSEDAGFQDDEAPVEKKKSGGGFLVKFLLFLIVIGGGLFASVKYLGVQIPYVSDMLGAGQPAVIAQQPVQPAPSAAQDTTSTTANADGFTTDMTTPPAGAENTGADIAWADEPAATGDDTMTAQDGMDDFTALSAGDDAAMDTADANANAGGFGLPPTTDDATDLSAMTGETPADSSADAGDVWGDMPSTTAADPAANPGADIAAADPFGAVPDATPETAPGTTDETASAITGETTGEAVPDTAAVNDAPETPVAATSQPAPVAADDTAVAAVAALQKEVTALEKELADLKKTTVSTSDRAGLTAALAALEKSAPAAAVKAESKPAAAPSASAKSTTTAAAPKPAAARQAWVLRSAKPGMAWISEKGSNEIKTISVGDNVAGIGKVTDIAADNSGRWVVSGTSGKINQ